MDAPEPFYDQTATYFTLRVFIRTETEVDGRLVAGLADTFLADLVFPRCQPFSLESKRAGEGAKVNMGEFSERRWKATQKKLLANELAVLAIAARTPDFPKQQISLSVHVNPPGGREFLVAGHIAMECSVPYLRHLAASPEKVEALLRFGMAAWNGVPGGPAYGFGNLAITPERPRFSAFPFESIKAPAERVHPIPVAAVGAGIDGNLADLYCAGRGIKGAFWANFLSAPYVAMVGSATRVGQVAPEARIEPLDHDGLLVVATPSPLPQDSDENRRRFLDVDRALQPAFLSKAETPAHKQALLGYFHRERTL